MTPVPLSNCSVERPSFCSFRFYFHNPLSHSSPSALSVSSQHRCSLPSPIPLLSGYSLTHRLTLLHFPNCTAMSLCLEHDNAICRFGFDKSRKNETSARIVKFPFLRFSSFLVLLDTRFPRPGYESHQQQHEAYAAAPSHSDYEGRHSRFRGERVVWTGKIHPNVQRHPAVA